MMTGLPSGADRIFLVTPLGRPKLPYMTDTTAIFGADVSAPPVVHAHFSIGDVVMHRRFGFRGVVFDIDPVFANSEEWYNAIPAEVRPHREQPFYHLLAENAESNYVAYVSQQNLLADDSGEPVDHPAIAGMFGTYAHGKYQLRPLHRH